MSNGFDSDVECVIANRINYVLVDVWSGVRIFFIEKFVIGTYSDFQ